jgi:hydrogenase maturation protease
MEFWREMERPGPESVDVAGAELRRGSRVRLHPRPRGDVLDLALDDQVGVVEGIEMDDTGEVQLAVTLEADPGRDLGEARFLGHRFFFRPDEVEPLDQGAERRARPRVLVAGVGNVFLGDDGFGVEVASRLAERTLPEGAVVVDFGIRGMDLAYALQDGYAAAIIVDAAARGEAPGTLTVIEPTLDPDQEAVIETHAMDPVRVLALSRSLGGGTPPRTLVVACEPAIVPGGEHDDDLLGELSEPVRDAVDGAVRLVESLVEDIIGPESREGG